MTTAQIHRLGVAALDAQNEIAAHAALEGCERCCGPIGEVEDIRRCPAVQEWGQTIRAFRDLAA